MHDCVIQIIISYKKEDKRAYLLEDPQYTFPLSQSIASQDKKKATSTLNNPFSKQSFLFMITICKQHTDCYRMNVDVTYPAETVVSLTDYNPPCATHWDSSQAWVCAPREEEPVLSKLCYVCPSIVNRESEEGKTSFTWCSLQHV